MWEHHIAFCWKDIFLSDLLEAERLQCAFYQSQFEKDTFATKANYNVDRSKLLLKHQISRLQVVTCAAEPRFTMSFVPSLCFSKLFDGSVKLKLPISVRIGVTMHANSAYVKRCGEPQKFFFMEEVPERALNYQSYH